MAKPIVLNATSPYEISLSTPAQARNWKQFLAGGSHHSAQACTLPYIMRRCEREGMPYELKAIPGLGYTITPKPEWRKFEY